MTSPSAPPSPPPVPFTKDEPVAGTQYCFVRTIGSGGHGTVIRVWHPFLEQHFAMKLLHAELGADAGLIRRAIAEAKILAKIDHPNVVKITDGGMTAERTARPFLVMEELHGMALAEALKKLPAGLGTSQALPIIVGILDGLDTAHTRYNIVHRDIKPQNIFLHRTTTDVTVPKLLDFGIAHVIAQQKRHTGDVFIGTPRYSSPEQIMGEPPTIQTDLYAVGLVLYECLTGQHPFGTVTDIGSLLHAHVHVRPRPLSEVLADVPPDLDAMVSCLLEKKPSRRPKSAASAAVALRSIQTRLDRLATGQREHWVSGATDPTPMENMLRTMVGQPGISIVSLRHPASAKSVGPPRVNAAQEAPAAAAPDANVLPNDTEKPGASQKSQRKNVQHTNNSAPAPSRSDADAIAFEPTLLAPITAAVDRSAQTRTLRTLGVPAAEFDSDKSPDAMHDSASLSREGNDAPPERATLLSEGLPEEPLRADSRRPSLSGRAEPLTETQSRASSEVTRDHDHATGVSSVADSSVLSTRSAGASRRTTLLLALAVGALAAAGAAWWTSSHAEAPVPPTLSAP